MTSQAIKILDENHSKGVIRYFKDKGVDTKGWEKLPTGAWCGLIHNTFQCVTHSISYYNTEVIELPKEYMIEDE